MAALLSRDTSVSGSAAMSNLRWCVVWIAYANRGGGQPSYRSSCIGFVSYVYGVNGFQKIPDATRRCHYCYAAP